MNTTIILSIFSLAATVVIVFLSIIIKRQKRAKKTLSNENQTLKSRIKNQQSELYKSKNNTLIATSIEHANLVDFVGFVKRVYFPQLVSNGENIDAEKETFRNDLISKLEVEVEQKPSLKEALRLLKDNDIEELLGKNYKDVHLEHTFEFSDIFPK